MQARLLFGALLLALSCTACSAPAQNPSTTPTALSQPLQVLAPLIGGQWQAEFPGGLTDTQRFESVLDGHFLRNVHEVRGQDGALVYAGETLYGWDIPTQTLRWWYFNSTGGYIVGTLVEEAGDEVVYEGENHGAAAQTARVRGSFRLAEVSDGRFTSVTWFQRDGEWQIERELVYLRR